MSELTEQGFEVIVAGLHSDDPTDFNYKEFLKMYIAAIEMWAFTTAENSEGLIVLVDAGKFSFSHLRRTDFNAVRTGFQYFQVGKINSFLY